MNDQPCGICGGELEAKRVTRLQKYQERWVLIENVPALVCSQCGETYYTPQAHDFVVDLLTSAAEPARVETVAVYDASGAA